MWVSFAYSGLACPMNKQHSKHAYRTQHNRVCLIHVRASHFTDKHAESIFWSIYFTLYFINSMGLSAINSAGSFKCVHFRVKRVLHRYPWFIKYPNQDFICFISCIHSCVYDLTRGPVSSHIIHESGNKHVIKANTRHFI